jgi:hypothetical protein
MATEICGTASFEAGVAIAIGPCKILPYVKDLYRYEKNISTTSSGKFTAIYSQVSLALLPHVLAGNYQRSMVDKSELRWGRRTDQKWSQCL